MIKAKYVYESILDLLKPKSKEEIEQATNVLSASKLLNIGIEKNMPDLIKKAFEKGAIVQSINTLNNLKRIFNLDNRGLVRLLVGINPSQTHWDELLKKSCQLGFYDLFNYTIQHEANINYKDKFGSTPLYYAAKHQWIDLVKKLVKYGANINEKNYEGVNIIQACISPATYEGSSNSKPINIDILWYLIDNGADIYAQNKYGFDFLRLAIEANSKFAYELIEKFNIKPSEQNICAIIRGGSLKLLKKAIELNPIDLNKPILVSKNKNHKYSDYPINLINLYDGLCQAKIEFLMDNGAKLTSSVIKKIKDAAAERDYYGNTDKWKKFMQKHRDLFGKNIHESVSDIFKPKNFNEIIKDLHKKIKEVYG